MARLFEEIIRSQHNLSGDLARPLEFTEAAWLDETRNRLPVGLLKTDPLGERDRRCGSFALSLFICRLGCFRRFGLTGFRFLIVALRHDNPPGYSFSYPTCPIHFHGVVLGCPVWVSALAFDSGGQARLVEIPVPDEKNAHSLRNMRLPTCKRQRSLQRNAPFAQKCEYDDCAKDSALPSRMKWAPCPVVTRPISVTAMPVAAATARKAGSLSDESVSRIS
jgi:hypothetical protein